MSDSCYSEITHTSCKINPKLIIVGRSSRPGAHAQYSLPSHIKARVHFLLDLFPQGPQVHPGGAGSTHLNPSCPKFHHLLKKHSVFAGFSLFNEIHTFIDFDSILNPILPPFGELSNIIFGSKIVPEAKKAIL